MVIRREEIHRLVAFHMRTVLDAAEAALPADQAKAFGRLVKRELGYEGLVADLEDLINRSATGKERHGTGRN